MTPDDLNFDISETMTEILQTCSLRTIERFLRRYISLDFGVMRGRGYFAPLYTRAQLAGRPARATFKDWWFVNAHELFVEIKFSVNR